MAHPSRRHVGLKPFRGTQIEKSHSLSRDLMAVWLFQEGSSTELGYYNIVNSNIGFLDASSVATETDPTLVAGSQGYAVLIDATDAIMTVADADHKDLNIDENESFTIWCRCRPSSNMGTSPARRIINKRGRGNGTYNGWQLKVVNEDDVNWEFNDTTIADGSSLFGIAGGDGGLYPMDVWYDIACVFDRNAGTWSAYVDGILDASVSAVTSSTLETSVPIEVGATAYLNGSSVTIEQEFKGDVESIFFYKRALSQSDLLNLTINKYSMFV